MTTNHTPAPWVAIKVDRGFIITNEDSSYDIAVVRNVAQRFDNEANARLIAGAPELLEALKWYVSEDDTNENYESNGYYLDGLRKAEQAIKKATGEENV